MLFCLLLSACFPSHAAILSGQATRSKQGPDWQGLAEDELVGLTLMEAKTAYQAGDLAKALELTHSARLKRPGQPKIILATVYIYMQMGDFEAALKDLGQVFKLDPKNTEVLRLMGPCHASLGRHQAAAAAYQALSKLEPENEKVLFSLGASYFRAGAVDKAIETYHQAVAMKPKNAEAHEALGAAYYQAKRYAEAIAAYEEAVKLDPDFAEAHNSLGTAYFADGEKKKAMDQVRRALKANPRYSEGHTNLATMLAMGKDYPAALPHLNTALSLNLLDGNAWNTLLLVLNELILLDKDQEIAPPPEELKGNALTDWHWEAYGKSIKSGSFPIAAKHLLGGLQANFRRPDLLTQLGVLLAESPFSALSPRFLQMAVALDPNYEMASRNLTLYYKNLSHDQLKIVQANMEEILETDPDNLLAHQNLGRVFGARKLFDEAIPHYLETVRLEPTNIASRISLSFALYQAGRVEPAFDLLLSCLELNSTSAEAWGKVLLAADMMLPASHPMKIKPLPIPREDLAFDAKETAMWHFRQARAYDMNSTNDWVMIARHLQESIQLDKGIPATFYMYGQLAKKYLNHRIALPFMIRANQLSPGYRPLEEELAEVRIAAAKESDQAKVDMLQKTLHNDPTNSVAAFALAPILLKHGKIPEAIKYLQQGLETSPTNVQARLVLSRALFASGKHDGAIKQIDLILKQGIRSSSLLFQRAWLMLEKPAPSKAELQSAIKLLTKARELEGTDTPATYLQTLAKGYYLQGASDQAKMTARAAIIKGKSEENDALVAQLSDELKKYENSSP